MGWCWSVCEEDLHTKPFGISDAKYYEIALCNQWYRILSVMKLYYSISDVGS